MRLLVKIGILVAIVLSVYFGYTSIKGFINEKTELKEEVEELKSENNFKKEAFKAFSQMDGEFYPDKYYISAYHPSKNMGGYKDAFGLKLRPGFSCAVNPADIPYNSLIYVEGYGKIFVACDTYDVEKMQELGRPNTIDICLESEEAVDAWGLRKERVYIYLNK